MSHPNAAILGLGYDDEPTREEVQAYTEEEVQAYTEEEVQAYATFLGVDLEQFPQLRSLVVDGLTAALPDGWSIHHSADGTFFVHDSTGLWLPEHPHDKVFRRRAELRMQEIRSGGIGSGTGASGGLLFGSCRQVALDVEPISDDDEWGGIAAPSTFRTTTVPDVARLERELIHHVLSHEPLPTPPPLSVLPTPPPPSLQPLSSPTEITATPLTARSLRRLTNVRESSSPSKAVAESPSRLSEPVALAVAAPAPPPRPKTRLPAEFVCPITSEIMKDPVVIADGFSYEREAIQRWFAKHDTSPVTGAVLINKAVFPNTTLRVHISEFMQSHEIDDED